MPTIHLPNGFLTLSTTSISCPKCGQGYDESDYYRRLDNSASGMIYMKCKGCGSMLGVTANYKGDVVCWLKKDEKNLNSK